MKKGTLKNVRGDVTQPQTTAPNEIVLIAHMCNDENKWGAGFVLALNKKWKEPEQRYRDFCKQKPLPMLGKVCYAKIDDNLAVANMIAQHSVISKDNPIPIKYQALANCMFDIVGYIKMVETKTGNPVVIHAPKFGSLRAKGNWDFILELIREIWLEAGIDVVVYEFEADKEKWGALSEYDLIDQREAVLYPEIQQLKQRRVTQTQKDFAEKKND